VLKRFFEHLNHFGGDYSESAENVTWLQLHGLRGVRSLLDAWPDLHHITSQPIDCIATNAKESVVNMHNQSMFAVAGSLIDKIVCDRASAGSYTLQLTNCRNRIALVAALAQCRFADGSITAYWRAEKHLLLHIVTTSSASQFPRYQLSKLSESDEEQYNVATLICSPLQSNGIDTIPEVLAKNVVLEIGGTELASRYEQGLQDGIEIDDSEFASICEIADRVLVEATEKSRQGAGE